MFLQKNVGTISTHRNKRKKYKEVGLPVFMLQKFPIFSLVFHDFDANGIYALALEVDCLQEKNGVTDCVLKEHPLIKKMLE